MSLFSFGINVCGREDGGGGGAERQMGVAYSHKPVRGKEGEGLLAEFCLSTLSHSLYHVLLDLRVT